MKKFNQILVRVCLLIVSFSFFAQAEEECKITVGYESAPPILYLDENNKIAGLDKEIVELIATKAECKIDWISIPWARAQDMMKTGALFMGTDAFDTPERRVYANMIPYRKDNPNRLFVMKDSLDKVKATNLKDYIDKTKLNIGVVLGYAYDDEIENLMKDPAYSKRFERVVDGEANINKLVHNRTDGFIMAQLLGNYFIKKNNLQDKISRYDFDFGFDSSSTACLMISKKADPGDKITKRLAKAIEEVRDTKEYADIINKYF